MSSNVSEQKVCIIVDVSNWIEMHLMFEEICMALVCRKKFCLCRASALSFLFMGCLLLSMSSFWISNTLAVQIDLSLTTIVQGLWGSS